MRGAQAHQIGIVERWRLDIRGSQLDGILHAETQELLDPGPMAAARGHIVEAGPRHQTHARYPRDGQPRQPAQDRERMATQPSEHSPKPRHRSSQKPHCRSALQLSQHLRGQDHAGDDIAERTGGDHQQAGQLLIGQRRRADRAERD
jgi:hypothetical protein